MPRSAPVAPAIASSAAAANVKRSSRRSPTSAPASYASLPKIAIAPNPAAESRQRSGPTRTMLATGTVHVHLPFVHVTV
jgi:hypothetical protein